MLRLLFDNVWLAINATEIRRHPRNRNRPLPAVDRGLHNSAAAAEISAARADRAMISPATGIAFAEGGRPIMNTREGKE